MKCEKLLNKKVVWRGKLVAMTVAMALHPVSSFAITKEDVAVVREELKSATDRVTTIKKEQTELKEKIQKLRTTLPPQKKELQKCHEEAEITDPDCAQHVNRVLKAKKIKDWQSASQPRFVTIYSFLGEDLSHAEVCRATLTECDYVRNHELLLAQEKRLKILEGELKAARDQKRHLDAELSKILPACTDCQGPQKSSEETVAKLMLGTAAINAFSGIANSLIGMGLGIEAMKHYGSNYNAYLNSCMQVGVPCPAPMASGFGMPMNSGFGMPMNSGFGMPMNSGFGMPMNSGFGMPMNSGYSTGYSPYSSGVGNQTRMPSVNESVQSSATGQQAVFNYAGPYNSIPSGASLNPGVGEFDQFGMPISNRLSARPGIPYGGLGVSAANFGGEDELPYGGLGVSSRARESSLSSQ